MSTRFRDYCPEQPFLLPPSPQDWLSDGHLAYLVRDLVMELDLGDIYRAYLKDPRGAPGYDPRMMVGILLYAFASDVFSSRRIARLCVDDLGGRYLAAGYQPDFRTLSAFQLQHGDALGELFVQSVHLCQAAGMVSLLHVASDGLKLEANASKHKAMSYGRMASTEERLRGEIANLQRQAREMDAEEDTLFGKDCPGPDIAEELKRRETRLARIRKAREALEAQAREAAAAQQAQRAAKEEQTGKPTPGKKPPSPQEARPKDKAQRNFTDPESRIMKAANGAFIQGYNGQAAVDGDHQVIVACMLTNQAADAPHFAPLMDQVAQNTGAVPAVRTADGGFFSKENVEHGPSAHTQTYIPPCRLKQAPEGSTETSSVPLSNEQLSAAHRMRRLLATPEGHAAYACRKKIVEPVFGQIKGCPGSPGFSRVLRRGLDKAQQEWRWICATHNFLKYLRHNCVSAAPA